MKPLIMSLILMSFNAHSAWYFTIGQGNIADSEKKITNNEAVELDIKSKKWLCRITEMNKTDGVEVREIVCVNKKSKEVVYSTAACMPGLHKASANLKFDFDKDARLVVIRCD